MSIFNRIFPILLFAIIPLWLESIAAEPEKRTLEIQLQAVHKDTPGINLSDKPQQGNAHPIRMVKIRDNPQFKSLPDTDANVLYYGEVKLGFPGRNHGVLIDFEGKEKRLWVDSNADHHFAEETGYQLFKSDRFPEINFYFSPTPINIQVAFDFKDHHFERLIQFNLPFLAVARTGYQDFFSLTTRTWFTGNIQLGNTELRVGVVDNNHNGVYNDPDDLLIIDRDFDLIFMPKESKSFANSQSIKLDSKRWNVSSKFLPEKLILTER